MAFSLQVSYCIIMLWGSIRKLKGREQNAIACEKSSLEKVEELFTDSETQLLTPQKETRWGKAEQSRTELKQLSKEKTIIIIIILI